MSIIKKIEAVILDWAGTVIDYGCFAPMQAFIKTFERKGIPITIEEARAPMGMLKWDHIQAILTMERVSMAWTAAFGSIPQTADVDQLYEVFEQLLMESLEYYTDPIPGVLEVVSQLRQSGIKIGSTTGYTKSMMDVVAPHAWRKGYAPDYLISSDEVERGRPFPYMIACNIAALEVTTPQSVVKVGDTVADVEEGKNAGVWSVAVIKGSSELGLTEAEVAAMQPAMLQERMNQVRQTFNEAGADVVIESMDELPAVIEALERQM